jgi:hypothetical protein
MDFTDYFGTVVQFRIWFYQFWKIKVAKQYHDSHVGCYYENDTRYEVHLILSSVLSLIGKGNHTTLFVSYKNSLQTARQYGTNKTDTKKKNSIPVFYEEEHLFNGFMKFVFLSIN